MKCFGAAVSATIPQDLKAEYGKYKEEDWQNALWYWNGQGSYPHGYEPTESFEQWKAVEADGGSHQGFFGTCTKYGVALEGPS